QRQARVHVVDVRNAEDRAGQPGEERAFLVRIQQVITPQAQSCDQVEEQQPVEPDLQARGARADRTGEMRSARAKHACPQLGRRVLTHSIGQDVDLVSACQQLAGTVIGTQRRATGSVEGLRNDFQYAHYTSQYETSRA